jgi:BMFP domain-containing protein YqiC
MKNVKLPFVSRTEYELQERILEDTRAELNATRATLTGTQGALESLRAIVAKQLDTNKTLNANIAQLTQRLEIAHASIRGYDYTMQGIAKLCALNMPKDNSGIKSTELTRRV